MPTRTLPEKVDRYIVKQILVPNWDASNTVGYDANASTSASEFLPVGPQFDVVGEPFPSVTVRRSNETAGGPSGYDYLDTTNSDPGQVRQGSVVVTASVEDREGGDTWTADSNTYSAISADELATALVQEVERICSQNAVPTSTELSAIGAYPGGDSQDPRTDPDPVRTESTTIVYTWLRS